MITRRALMISCASAALASVAPQRANAQAFSGGIIGSTGSVTRTPTSSTTETITIGSNTATINWNAGNQQGGTVNFLPSGNTATFTSSSGITDYTVLNRILPESGLPISINGRVISTLQGTSTTGGHIWFYSPAGIVVGATAVFDVGGLLLTTNDVTNFGTTANGFNASFSGAPGSTAKIQIMPGAEINALQQNSYVALVAPRIEQGGKVRVNGTAAYAAGEQLSMTMNQGLFDIQVDVGTGDQNGIVHTGETSGPANATAADNHKIYMVAVPKNQALTMLLGGKVGFDDAVSASVRNGQIFLSSGWGVQDSDGSSRYYTSTPGLNAGIDIGPGNYTSDVLALGQGMLTAAADTGDITFGGNLEFNSWSGTGPIEASLVASDGHHLSIAGDADLLSSGYSSWGSSSITASSGGSVTIGGAADLSSWNGSRGGNANLSADGGSISIGGATHLYAAGASDPAGASEGNGADGWGGSISVEAANAGSITTGAMQLDAYGSGQASGATGTGGDGHGGSISISADSGRVTVNGNLTANASGIGGNAGSQGGAGQGGHTNLLVNGGDITVHGDLNLLSNGLGGGAQTAGDGFGGSTIAQFTGGEGFGNGGSLTVGGDLSMQAAGTGGNGADHPEATGGQGGDGHAGSAFFYVSPNLAEGATVTIDIANTEIFANGTGGNGGSGLIGGDAGSGYAYSSSGEGGFFNGGATLELWAGTLTTGDLLVYSTARGGNGGTGSSGAGGLGGDAYGGTSGITVGGDLTADLALSYARALAGSGGTGSTQGDGGYASGGSSSIDVVAGGHLTSAVDLSTSASGGAGNTGGDAYGGFSRLNVEGTLTAPTASISATAQGGGGVIQGGNAGGGTVNFDVSGGTAALSGATTLNANAFGGNAASGHGGFAGGGSADLATTDGGSLIGQDLAMGASGTGGNGIIAGGGSGGEIDLAADATGSELPTAMSFAEANLSANGNLGTGGRDGQTDGVGGDITVESSGASITAKQLSLQANGTDFGGVIDLQSGLDFDGVKGTLQFGGVRAIANGGDNGGLIVVASGSRSTIDLGTADLTASGGFGGLIYLLAGTCVQCGGGEEMAPLSAPLPAGGGIAATDLTLNTTGNIFMGLSGGADISVSGKLLGNAGQLISMFDDGSGGAIRAHDIELSAVLIQDDADIIADIIKFTSSGTMTLGNLTATDTMTLTAGGDLITGDLSAGNALTLTAGNDAETGNLSGQAVKVTASRDLSVGDVHAPGSATFTAGGLATFDGIVSAPTITVTSSDIDITDGASLGVSGITNLITLNAVANGLPIVIGDGPAAEGQYHLDEDGDIRTASLVINAVGSTGSPNPDVNVFDTQIEGSATNGGGVGNVTLNTGGSVFVEGDVRFINAGASDKLTINAGSNIEVNTDSGSIVITDAAGHLAGTLGLNANNVWVASQSILDQLESDPNFTGRDTALGTNSGTANQDGFIRAGAITAGVANTFLVQNSGTTDLFAGIDTGAGGLSVQSTGNTPAVVVIYGRQTDATGAVITNQDFLNNVALSGTGGFTQDSAVNGCPIAGSCAKTTFTVDMSSILGPLDETNSPDDQKKKKDKKGEDSDDGSSADPNLRLINTTPINLDHTIDEPVTSGGDVVVGGFNQPN